MSVARRENVDATGNQGGIVVFRGQYVDVTHNNGVEEKISGTN